MPWDKWNRKTRLRQQEIHFCLFVCLFVIIGRIDQVLKRTVSIRRVMKIVIITMEPVTVLYINDIMCATLFLECTSISKIYCIYLNIFVTLMLPVRYCDSYRYCFFDYNSCVAPTFCFE